MAKEVKSKRKPRQRFKQVDVYVPKFGLIADFIFAILTLSENCFL